MSTDTVLTNREISEVLVESGIVLSTQEVVGYDIAIARAIEQAVLQSHPIESAARELALWAYGEVGADPELTPGLPQLLQHFGISDDVPAALQSQDREDSARLDWLEEQAQTSRTGVSIDYVYDAQDGYVNEKGYRFMRHRFIGPLGKTAREAIDRARRIEENKQ